MTERPSESDLPEPSGTSIDAAVQWAIGYLRRNAPGVSLGVAEQVNAALHRAVDVDDPCPTACTHVLFDEWTALGLANVVGRNAWRFL